MSRNWKAIVFAALCAAGLFAYDRHASRSTAFSSMAVDAGKGQADVAGKNALSANLRAGEVLPVDERIELSDGVEDVKNQFAFVVMVKASVEAAETLKCTGVFISPRLVLTAGHCVCARHKFAGAGSEPKFVIDGSACAEEAEVTTITYHPLREDSAAPPGFQAKTYRAKVSVHPALKVLLDEQSLVLSSNADLAVALLDEPVETPFLPVRLADSEVRLGEIILMAGYGLDATTDLLHGVRRSGQKEVKRLPEDGGDEMLFAASRESFATGSGEACLRHESTGLSLVGLSGKAVGSMPGCTSLHMHREWLEVEVQRSRTDASDEDGGVK
jgi:hypothetical protein